MDFSELFGLLLQDNKVLLWGAGIALLLCGLFLVANHLRRVKQDVMRRVAAEPGTFSTTTLNSTARIANRMKHAVEAVALVGGVQNVDAKEVKQLRAKLVQAGYFDANYVALFFGLRLILGGSFAFIVAVLYLIVAGLDPWTHTALAVLFAFAIGYLGPLIILNRRLGKSADEHRTGFPDFMDLMVVCVEAGLSMESGLQRIAHELRSSFPSLSMHIEITTVEIRSGKTLSGAVESFSRRLGIEEAASFATLLTQSEELGSSLSQSLRVYSDDMRNKRLMKAEEKASSLPAKLVVPLTLFVFPTLLVVLLLPVVIKVSKIM